ncbi:sulfate adenylyltransferase subunit CysD [Acuticoccus sp. MNP-M23]|uniref:sulfate adenylyltransferase subunit CysD n=1 Tax=Acuticoccus sp. MNP-M23 TaxID=3072793 RepID=UPI002815BFB1|nr:sulfate adenylyltransferase subunit CysD [Acuticoccus sp. MNP-M23]WMS43953.1 sulfate adenylyltransferase subunit CysD [Acuticoccus sp. MNP-M23]
MMALSPNLAYLESEAIHIIRDGFAEAKRPVVLFSGGKDSTVLAHLVLRAFYPAPPPIPLLHVDSTWEFREVVEFRDRFARNHGFDLVVKANEEGRRQNINPFEHGDTYTTMMRTDPLKAALTDGGYDVIFGGARRDEEASRAKERIASVRNANHGWEPRNQRPELWRSYNWRLGKGQSIRAYPISNWTEHDLWTYIRMREIELAPLYFAADRPVVVRDGLRLVVDDDARMQWRDGETPTMEKVRFRTLGCWPVTGADPSDADHIDAVMYETLTSGMSERRGRVSDSGSLERQKRDGYF